MLVNVKNSYITSSVDNPNDIANIFNTFFTNIDKTTGRESLGEVIAPLFYVRGNYSGSILLSPVTSNEI